MPRRPLYAITGTGHHSRSAGKDKVGRAVRAFLADRRYAWREFSAPNDRNGMGGVLGIDPGSGSVEPPQLPQQQQQQQQQHGYGYLPQHQLHQSFQQQVQRMVVITPRLSLPVNTPAASAVAAAAAGNAGSSSSSSRAGHFGGTGRSAGAAAGVRVGGAYVPGTGVTRAGFGGTAPGAPPPAEAKSAVDDVVAAMKRKAEVAAAAAAEPTEPKVAADANADADMKSGTD
jgi:hypothetical protein